MQEVFIYPLKPSDNGYSHFYNLVPDFEASPTVGKLINYVSGTKDFWYEGFEFVAGTSYSRAYLQTKLLKDELPCDYAYVVINGKQEKVMACQVRFEKVKGIYEEIFSTGVSPENIDRALTAAKVKLEICTNF